MFEEIVESVASPWTFVAAAILITRGGRKLLRAAGKEAIRAGLVVSDRLKEVVAEVKEEANDVVAEVKAERKDQSKAHKSTT